MELPSTLAAQVITPLELAATENLSDPVVVNITRLLQTLDADGNPENGIEITEAAKTVATQVDFTLETTDFEISTAVTDLITGAGQDTTVTALVATEDAIAHFEQSLNSEFSINLTQYTASSEIITADCPQTPGGWDYTFNETSMTLTGSDTFFTPECTLGDEETFSVTMQNLDPDFDIPFNCESYPVCSWDDLNKVITGVDEDDRDFTSTYSFDRTTYTLTYIKQTGQDTFTETATLHSIQ